MEKKRIPLFIKDIDYSTIYSEFEEGKEYYIGKLDDFSKSNILLKYLGYDKTYGFKFGLPTSIVEYEGLYCLSEGSYFIHSQDIKKYCITDTEFSKNLTASIEHSKSIKVNPLVKACKFYKAFGKVEMMSLCLNTYIKNMDNNIFILSFSDFNENTNDCDDVFIFIDKEGHRDEYTFSVDNLPDWDIELEEI